MLQKKDGQITALHVVHVSLHLGHKPFSRPPRINQYTKSLLLDQTDQLVYNTSGHPPVANTTTTLLSIADEFKEVFEYVNEHQLMEMDAAVDGEAEKPRSVFITDFSYALNNDQCNLCRLVIMSAEQQKLLTDLGQYNICFEIIQGLVRHENILLLSISVIDYSW